MTQIAKNFTNEQWLSLEEKIREDFSNKELWTEAFGVFESRLNERYLTPARIIEKNNSFSGAGFAIATILCSLIEALETFYEGVCYKHNNPNRDNYEYGIGESKRLFTNFLCTKEPFNSLFTTELADDFYSNVRCALLHEAMTRNRWVIKVDTNTLINNTEGKSKILNRRIFLESIKSYIQNYKEELFSDDARKNAFIRKMNCICQNT